MRYVRDLTGRFPERPHFEPAELDAICDRAILDHVDQCGRKLEYPISSDLLETLIEAHAASLDLFADLSGEGADVQGVTDFFRGKRPRVRIDAGLANDKNREVRLRTTLAHEFGHVHLHDALFQANDARLDLFAGTAGKAAQVGQRELARCKRETIVDALPSDWMEWQAGYVCGALLMPRRKMRELVHGRMREARQTDELELGSDLGRRIVAEVIERFFVSGDAARVRLKVLELAVEKRRQRSVFE
jgi:hypothetical protein